jgi:hypothetical protein
MERHSFRPSRDGNTVVDDVFVGSGLVVDGDMVVDESVGGSGLLSAVKVDAEEVVPSIFEVSLGEEEGVEDAVDGFHHSQKLLNPRWWITPVLQVLSQRFPTDTHCQDRREQYRCVVVVETAHRHGVAGRRRCRQ